MKKYIWQLLNKLKIGAPIQLAIAGYLRDIGWIRSFYTKRSIDAKGNPLPWLAYPSIHFLEGRLSGEIKMFEYGSGNSTFWFANKVGKITSVEHDEAWYKLLCSELLPENAQLIFRPLSNGYAVSCTEANEFYDIVLVDGRHRNDCVKYAVTVLSELGVLIFDNSHIEEYASSIELLKRLGFRRIDFWGMSPITPVINCTTIFYRSNNVLNI